jgi:hypothetical protein
MTIKWHTELFECGKSKEILTVSQLITMWQEALEKYGDVKVMIDYDGQYCWSPRPDNFFTSTDDDKTILLATQ